MFYAAEALSPTVLDGLPEPTPLNPNALKMAEQLIQALAAEFHPKQYHNEYREALMRLIQQKTAARVATIHPMEPQQPPEDLTSLLSALQASLDRIYNLRKNDGTAHDFPLGIDRHEGVVIKSLVSCHSAKYIDADGPEKHLEIQWIAKDLE